MVTQRRLPSSGTPPIPRPTIGVIGTKRTILYQNRSTWGAERSGARYLRAALPYPNRAVPVRRMHGSQGLLVHDFLHDVAAKTGDQRRWEIACWRVEAELKKGSERSRDKWDSFQEIDMFGMIEPLGAAIATSLVGQDALMDKSLPLLVPTAVSCRSVGTTMSTVAELSSPRGSILIGGTVTVCHTRDSLFHTRNCNLRVVGTVGRSAVKRTVYSPRSFHVSFIPS